MSVAELTISYIGKPGSEAFNRVRAADLDISLQKRKLLLTLPLSFLVLFTALYLYFAGLIVALNIEERGLKEKLDYALILSSERESELAKVAYGKNSDFFKEKGFERPLSIEIIKRGLNVVEIKNVRTLY